MLSKFFCLVGHYKGNYSQPVRFSVTACNHFQARQFVRSFVPDFVIKSVTVISQKESQHFDFAIVNAACSARLHLTNRRETGCAVRRRTPVNRRHRALTT
jgi:hypothetical protein